MRTRKSKCMPSVLSQSSSASRDSARNSTNIFPSSILTSTRSARAVPPARMRLASASAPCRVRQAKVCCVRERGIGTPRWNVEIQVFHRPARVKQDETFPSARRLILMNLLTVLRHSFRQTTRASLPSEEVRTTYELSSLTDEQVALFAKQGTREMAEALGKISAQRAVVANLEEEMENRQQDIDGIVKDQGRLRENRKALRGSAEERVLVQR